MGNPMDDISAPDITTGIHQILASKKRLYPSHVNRISQIDDPCARKLYYYRAAWDKAEPTDDGLQGVFETGNILEPVIERIISEVGAASTPQWRIIGSQMPTGDNLLQKYQISGTVDGFLQVRVDDRWVTLGVVDIKTMSGNVFARVTDYESLGRFSWTRKYRGQVMLYSLAHNHEWCFLLLVNKNNLFDMRLISFPVDLEYCEGLLKKAELVNNAIDANTPPDGVNDPDICPRCPFYSYCCPDMTTGGNLTICDTDELGAILDRLLELEPMADEIKDLEAQRDAMLVKGENMICGSWLITWKETANKQWRKKIVKIPLPASPRRAESGSGVKLWK